MSRVAAPPAVLTAAQQLIPHMPPDTETVPVSRTIGTDRVVDEMIFRFTHTLAMDWMLPGVPPVVGATAAHTVLDPSLPSNALIDRGQG